ncbi:hypothetical protein N2W54_004727 [Lotmaria passim]
MRSAAIVAPAALSPCNSDIDTEARNASRQRCVTELRTSPHACAVSALAAVLRRYARRCSHIRATYNRIVKSTGAATSSTGYSSAGASPLIEAGAREVTFGFTGVGSASRSTSAHPPATTMASTGFSAAVCPTSSLMSVSSWWITEAALKAPVCNTRCWCATSSSTHAHAAALDAAAAASPKGSEWS